MIKFSDRHNIDVLNKGSLFWGCSWGTNELILL